MNDHVAHVVLYWEHRCRTRTTSVALALNEIMKLGEPIPQGMHLAYQTALMNYQTGKVKDLGQALGFHWSAPHLRGTTETLLRNKAVVDLIDDFALLFACPKTKPKANAESGYETAYQLADLELKKRFGLTQRQAWQICEDWKKNYEK